MSIKTHLQKHKAVYITGGVCLVVGTAAGVLIGGRPLVETQVSSKIIQVLSWKPKATLEVYVEALGDPGNIIQDTTTGTIYASQGQAARELGLNPARISEQIRGIRDTVNGHTFEVLGKAPVSEAA